jgi:nicotinate-nucleotide pyrophosphorylase (carboxylating)
LETPYRIYPNRRLTLELPEAEVKKIIARALAEDLGHGDITSELLIPAGLEGRAYIQIKAPGILAGIEVAGAVFHQVDAALKFEVMVRDGTRVKRGDIAATVSGRVVSILKAERTVLNFLQRLSGIATGTARYVARVKGIEVRITDTRKTVPGLRVLEKYAVRTGGGMSHRAHLGDAVLIKDNHLAALRALGLGLGEIVAKARQNAPAGMRVEVEVTDMAEAREAAAAGADVVMLDNIVPEEMRRIVKQIPPRVQLEASGGITLANVKEVAATGVNTISIGALTHSSKALDISLELEPSTMKLT